MSGWWGHLAVSVRLHFRNKTALTYGHLFPLLFLAAFGVIYRHEQVPFRQHLGEILTVSILGGACFGLPTSIVSDRERGMWRRYRVLPVAPWHLLAGTVLARYLIITSAALLQLAVALSAGMTIPSHPVELFVAFTIAAFSFMGLGLTIAALADTVVAVQALGQCIFLPMLIIGGVAVPLESLPLWAQSLSSFFPGRYAVAAMQAGVTGRGEHMLWWDLCALVVMGGGAFFAGGKLFRWEMNQRFARHGGKGWLSAWLAAALVVGVIVNRREYAVILPTSIRAEPPPRPGNAVSPLNWTSITSEDIAQLDFAVPADSGVVTPFAAAQELPDNTVQEQLRRIRANLPFWPPASEGDVVQRVRACLVVCAVADAAQSPVESYLPPAVLEYLSNVFPREPLVKILTWIALHPNDGQLPDDYTSLGLEARFDGPEVLRERARVYAIKFIARLTGRVAPGGARA